MRKISEIYAEYNIIQILRDHMLRVAAVASMICDNSAQTLPKNDIITACLLHDMGNIIKFDFSYFPEFFEPEGVEYWQNVRDEFVRKYGKNEHEATVNIFKELGLSSNIVSLADGNRFSLMCDHLNSENMSEKIMHYVDARVGPHGVLSYQERMDEAGERYKNHKDYIWEEERQKLVACGKEIEKQIFAKCRIKPEDITDETIKPIIESLKNFVIE